MEIYIAPYGDDKASGTIDQPMRTPRAALGRIRAVDGGYWDGSAAIVLRGGSYPMTEPLDIELDMPLTLRAYEGEQPVLDGGRPIEGLTEGELNGMRCWTADIPDVREGKWFFRSLFAGGRRAVRAYLPRNDFYWIESTPDPEWTRDGQLFDGEYSFITREGDMKEFKNLTDVEMHVFHYWADEHMPVKSFDPVTREVVSTHRSVFALKDDWMPRFAKYRIEHIFEGLCEPGDFYLDRAEGRLYYLPHEDETLEGTVLTAPVVEQLVRVRNSDGVRFEGIAFRHTDWSLRGNITRNFEDMDPAVLYASSPQAASHLPGVISFERARRCAVVDCEISHVGFYAIDCDWGCYSMQLQRNVMSDMGAGGVKLNGAHAGQPKCDQTHHVLVTDNDIGFGGRVFLAGIGVASLHGHHITIAHNHIHDLYYSGVSCGWLWSYGESVCRDNIIEYNHIHTLGHGILSDMGGIYTLSVQPGTVIRNNLIYDIEKANYGGWAIYPDEGSSHILIENNVCYGTSSSVFHQHYGRENIVRNNIWAFGREGMIAYTRAEPHMGFTFERNIVITRDQPIFTGGGVGNIKSDMNLFWDVTGKPLTWAERIGIRNDTYKPLEELKELGYDMFSAIADPKCADPEHGDFTLAPDSPALAMGFRPIDLSSVGPRK